MKHDLIVNNGDLLFSWSATLGVFKWAGPQGVLNQHIFKVLPNPNIDPDYLYYALLSVIRQLSSKTHGSTMKHVVRGDFESTAIPLPPLSEQRKITDILERAAGIARLRAQAQAKVNEIVPALFVDMFGDPANNTKGWKAVPFGSVGQLDRGKSKHRPRNAPQLFGGAYPFIQTGDVANSGGRISSFSATYSDFGLAQSKLWKKGTLCITIAANIAKTGILEFDSCFPDSVVGFIPGPRVCTEYVQTWLSFLQPTLEATAPQAAQKNINLEILRALPIPVPPLELQREFVSRLTVLNGVSQLSQSASNLASSVQLSLLSMLDIQISSASSLHSDLG